MSDFKILLVDDDAEDRDILIDAFKQLDAGDIILYAEHGEAGLKLLAEKAAQNSYPCLVVLDLNMPRMNGRDTLRNLKNDPRFQKIQVVIYSTSVNPLEKEACMTLGAHSYITKPVSLTESLEMARHFLQLCHTYSLA